MTGQPKDMPDAYLPLRESDLLKLGDRDAAVVDPEPKYGGLIIVQVAVRPEDLTWVGRYRP